MLAGCVLVNGANAGAVQAHGSRPGVEPCERFRDLGHRGADVTIMGSALAAATRLDKAPGQAVSLRGLASACAGTGDYDQARAYLERCLPLYQRLDNRIGEAWTQQNLSVLAEAQGRYADALSHNEQALRLFRQARRMPLRM